MTSARIAGFAHTVSALLPHGSRVLEIGSGKGELATLLRDAGFNVTAIDPKAEPNTGIIPTTFESFAAPDHPYAAIVMQLVLHHAADLPSFLDKAKALLRSDASFVAIDDYGWERAGSDVPDSWKTDRTDLHTSKEMLRQLRTRFVQVAYHSHAYFEDGAGDDRLAFTFVGSPARHWPLLLGERESRPIILIDHRADWALAFASERERIIAALRHRARRVEHIGSTSVPGLAAKPIIDILVAVDDPLDDEIRALLQRAGYEWRVEEPEHRMFRTPRRDVHVHLWAEDSFEIGRHLRFRDRLRADALARKEYEDEKRALAKRQWHDMNEYADAKTGFIERILLKGYSPPLHQRPAALPSRHLG